MSETFNKSAVGLDLESTVGPDLNLDLRLDEMTVRPKRQDRYFVKSYLGKTSNTTLRILSVRGVPPPLYGLFFWQKRSYGFGGAPPPRLRIFPRKFSLKKG